MTFIIVNLSHCTSKWHVFNSSSETHIIINDLIILNMITWGSYAYFQRYFKKTKYTKRTWTMSYLKLLLPLYFCLLSFSLHSLLLLPSSLSSIHLFFLVSSFFLSLLPPFLLLPFFPSFFGYFSLSCWVGRK